MDTSLVGVESLISMKIPCGLAAVLDSYLSEYFLLSEANTQSSLLKHSINGVRENEVPSGSPNECGHVGRARRR